MRRAGGLRKKIHERYGQYYRLAHEQKLSINEILGLAREPLTHRQYVGWVEWLDEQWNNPSRSDHYLMQIAEKVLQASDRIKNPNSIDRRKLVITFNTEGDESPEVKKPTMTLEQATMYAKQRSLARMTMAVSHVVMPRDQESTSGDE